MSIMRHVSDKDLAELFVALVPVRYEPGRERLYNQVFREVRRRLHPSEHGLVYDLLRANPM